jgi:hypothetical protein
LLTVDLAHPAAPRIVATNSPPDQAAGVAVAGGVLYTAAGLAGIETYDLTLPASPRWLGAIPAGYRVRDATIRNGIAYLACGEAGLLLFDVADPAAPRWLGAMATATRADAVAVDGALAFLADNGTGLRVLDVTNPRAPAQLAVYSSPSLPAIRRVDAAGGRAVLTDGYRIECVDATTPTAPRLCGTGRIDGFAFGLAFDGVRLAVAAGYQGLLVLTNDGSVLALATQVRTGGVATDVALDGARAWVAVDDQGWRQFDLADPANPVLLSASTDPDRVVALAAAERRLLLADGLAGARSLGVPTPLTPVPGDRFGPLVCALRVAAGGATGAVVEDTAGAALLDLASGDRDRDGLPDAWEQVIVDADPNDAIATLDQVRPDDDFDGDGATNLGEYLAGTSAIDPGSTFVLAIRGGAPDAVVELRWTSVPGKRYAIYRTTDLAAGFRLIEGGIGATPPVNAFTQLAPGPTAYYLIAVQ